MLFAGFLVLIGLLLLLVWLIAGRKNIMVRNLGLITMGIGIVLSVIGLVLYFVTA